MSNKKINLYKLNDILSLLKEHKIYANDNDIWKLAVTKDSKHNYFVNAQVFDSFNNRTEKEFTLYVDNTHFIIYNIINNIGLVKDVLTKEYKDLSEQWIVYLYKTYPQKRKSILNIVTKEFNSELKKIDHQISYFDHKSKVANLQKQKIINKYYKLIDMLKYNEEDLIK